MSIPPVVSTAVQSCTENHVAFSMLKAWTYMLSFPLSCPLPFNQHVHMSMLT